MKNLIVYFSWSGNTDKLVNEINSKLGYDVVRIERKEPYSEDYDTCAYVEAKEEWQKQIYPKISGLNVDVNNYDRILLFYPIWWYTFPMPVATFIERLNGYKGEVIMFENSYTNDPQYVDNSIRDFKKINDSINMKQGLFNKGVSEHIKFIENLVI